ncbi:MAG: alkaline phosphatase family protein [Planctomycetota bacterium]|nr:MAG: alkaline phosphatase family protein [Planctomycetota bacterium]
MKRLCILNVVGLTPRLAQHAPNLQRLGAARPWSSPIPAVTCTSQATMLTGLPPRQHGVVGNGWYFRDTGEVRFWQQCNRLVQGEKFYEGYETAKLFWWFNQGAPVRWYATPKPHYGCDGSKVFDILDKTDCNLQAELGPFPFFSFWGPKAGLPSSQWIARAAARVLRSNRPQLTLVYLPHLDYDYQRLPERDPARVVEVDACAAEVIAAADDIGAQTIVVSEYGLVPVSRPILINRALREAGWLEVRDGPFGEMLQPLDSRAFAVADHQVAHIYVNDIALREDVRRLVAQLPGVQAVVEAGDVQLDHPRSGELIALAEPDAWFVYYYWLEDARAPDFARCVDIHRKPGYDPCELFMTSPIRAALRLAQKKLGFRYRTDVIPLDPSLVRGSHALHPDPQDGPAIIGPGAPDTMLDFKSYVRELLAD